MSNNILQLPPISVPFVDTRTQQMTTAWSSWFNNIHYQVTPARNRQTMTAAASVDPDALCVTLDSSAGGYAITLAAPTVDGIFKSISMTVHTGSVTLSLANCFGGTAATTCTWNNTSQVLLLYSVQITATTFKWLVFKQQGVTLT